MITVLLHGAAHVPVAKVVAILLTLALMVIAGCAAVGAGTFTRQGADEIVGVATTPESRQCRLELAVTAAIVIMADNTLTGGASSEAGALGAKVDALSAALGRARTAAPELRELQIARTLNELTALTSTRLRRIVGSLITGGVPSEDQILGFVRTSVTGDAAIAAIREAVRAIDASERTLVQCQAAVDGELAVQVARLEAAAKPR